MVSALTRASQMRCLSSGVLRLDGHSAVVASQSSWYAERREMEATRGDPLVFVQIVYKRTMPPLPSRPTERLAPLVNSA